MRPDLIDAEIANDFPLMEALRSAVPQLLSDPHACIEAATFHSVAYPITVATTESLRRIRGTTRAHGELQSWSLFLKSIRAPSAAPSVSHHWDYWLREAEAYTRGIIPPAERGFGGAACFGVLPSLSGIRLLLEDVTGVPAANWSVERYGLCSYHLGQFQARSVLDAGHPQRHWLQNDWIDRYMHRSASLATVELLGNDALWAAPLAQMTFPEAAQIRERVATVWSHRAALLQGLRSVSQTINHNDLWPPNLLSVDTEPGVARSVAIDLSWVGAGALGQDLASLVLDSVYEFYQPLHHLDVLEKTVLKEYIRGLRSEGWNGDIQAVYFAYRAASGLRFGIEAMQLLRNLTTPERQHAMMESYGLSLVDIARDTGVVVGYALKQGLSAIAMLRT